MTGTKPPRRRKVRATAKQTARVLDKREREVKRIEETTVHDLMVPDGDGKVGIGHSVKFGASDKSSWMTVESSCYISLPCVPTAQDVEDASDAASELAYKLMHKNALRVQEDLEGYLEGGK